jgi:hypothetical protein
LTTMLLQARGGRGGFAPLLIRTQHLLSSKSGSTQLNPDPVSSKKSRFKEFYPDFLFSFQHGTGTIYFQQNVLKNYYRHNLGEVFFSSFFGGPPATGTPMNLDPMRAWIQPQPRPARLQVATSAFTTVASWSPSWSARNCAPSSTHFRMRPSRPLRSYSRVNVYISADVCPWGGHQSACSASPNHQWCKIILGPLFFPPSAAFSFPLPILLSYISLSPCPPYLAKERCNISPPEVSMCRPCLNTTAHVYIRMTSSLIRR